jgi:hypothetical protein
MVPLFLFPFLCLCCSLSAPVRNWRLADSITGSPACWRALETDNYKNIDFVKNLPPQDCRLTYDGEHDGHGGALIVSIANVIEIDGWLTIANPDIALVHPGTNDSWGEQPTSRTIDSFTIVFNKIRTKNLKIEIRFAQIIPPEPTGISPCPQHRAGHVGNATLHGGITNRRRCQHTRFGTTTDIEETISFTIF